MTLSLRPYQEEGIEAIRSEMRAGTKRMVYVLPTGGGKTVMFAVIARGAASRNNRVMILVHRREILEQTLASLYRLCVVAGQVAPGMPVTGDYIQVAMVQTLARRLGSVRRPDLIIVDECHHAIADNSWGRILKYWSGVPCVGFTATPERLDGTGLIETFDRMLLGPSISDLVRDGWLAYPVIYRPPEEVAEQYRVKRGDFDASEQSRVMSSRKVVGDVIEHYRAHMDGLPAVCFCVSIQHSQMMADTFAAAGYRSAVVYGDMPKSEREAAIKGLADGSVQIVTSCDVISEGVDVPVMAGAILLRRTMSLGLYLQQAGRALRLSPGKSKAIILDHVGNYHLHGHVLADRRWSLESGRRDPRKEEPPTTVTCPRCYGVWPGRPRTCPDCGYSFVEDAPRPEVKPFRVIAGELVEALPDIPQTEVDSLAAFLTRTQGMDGKTKTKAMWGKAYDLALKDPAGKRKLDALREALGYKQGWTEIVWREVMRRRA